MHTETENKDRVVGCTGRTYLTISPRQGLAIIIAQPQRRVLLKYFCRAMECLPRIIYFLTV